MSSTRHSHQRRQLAVLLPVLLSSSTFLLSEDNSSRKRTETGVLNDGTTRRGCGLSPWICASCSPRPPWLWRRCSVPVGRRPAVRCGAGAMRTPCCSCHNHERNRRSLRRPTDVAPSPFTVHGDHKRHTRWATPLLAVGDLECLLCVVVVGVCGGVWCVCVWIWGLLCPCALRLHSLCLTQFVCVRSVRIMQAFQDR